MQKVKNENFSWDENQETLFIVCIDTTLTMQTDSWRKLEVL